MPQLRHLIACTAFLWVMPLAAQSDSAHVASLSARLDRGDESARLALENEAWKQIKTTGIEGHLDPVAARTLARAALRLLGPHHDVADSLSTDDHRWRGAAVDALLSAVAQDPDDQWSVTKLIELAPYPYIWLAPTAETGILRRITTRSTTPLVPLLATLAQLELEAGHADSAALLLDQIPEPGIPPAQRGHLAADVAFAEGHDSAGATLYYDGARQIHDSFDVAAYSRELAWIAQPAEIDEWNALAPEAREPWLEKFWNRRDIADGRLPGTRLPEQFRRWRVALRSYRWDYDGSMARGLFIPPIDGAEYNYGDVRFPQDPEISPLTYANRERPLSLVLDDRGGLLLRHGEPTSRSNLPGISGSIEELWSWATPNGPLLVGFSRSKMSVLDTSSSERFGMFARNYPPGDLATNCALDPRLCPLEAMVNIDMMQKPPALSVSTLALADPIHDQYTAMRDTLERTDDNAETFANDLHAAIQIYGVPDVGALVVYAVPAPAISTDSTHDAAPTHFSMLLRVVAGDSASGEFAAAVDTTRSWTLKQGTTKDAQIMGYTVVPVPPGEWSVAAVLSDVARRVGTGKRIHDVPVVAFDGKALRISDLILGSNRSGITWFNHGAAVPLNPRNLWHPDEPVVLSYTLDGLIVGHSYRTEIEVWDAKGSPKTFNQAIAFATDATGPQLDFQRELSLRDLGAGDYRVVIRVTDVATRLAVTRQQTMLVRP